MDLYSLTAAEVQDLMDAETDPAILRLLADLERAKMREDYEMEADAIADLTQLLVYERGLGLDDGDEAYRPLVLGE